MSQPSVPPQPVLSYESQQQLQLAKVAYRKVGRTIAVARGDGWTIGFFGGLSFLVGVAMVDFVGIILGMLLCAVAWNELGGAADLKKLDPLACARLGRNQLYLCGMLAAYFLWNIGATFFGHGDLPAELQVDPIMIRNLTIGAYGVLLLVVCGGALAMRYYYYSRQKFVDAYLTTTPEWIIDMQKAGMTF